MLPRELFKVGMLIATTLGLISKPIAEPKGLRFLEPRSKNRRDRSLSFLQAHALAENPSQLELKGPASLVPRSLRPMVIHRSWNRRVRPLSYPTDERPAGKPIAVGIEGFGISHSLELKPIAVLLESKGQAFPLSPVLRPKKYG